MGRLDVDGCTLAQGEATLDDDPVAGFETIEDLDLAIVRATERELASLDVTFGDDPPEVKEQLAGRLSQLEGDLVRSLGVPPAWEVEFGRYAPAPAADA